ncbi:hypothetical protein Tco_0829422 [Tanacetum coccineum]
MTESTDRLFDEGNGAEEEHSTEGGEYVALTKAIVEPVNEDAAEKPRRLKKKRKTAGDASGSTLPPKKLREDYGSSTTVPFVTSSVTPTPEREGGECTNSVSGPNLRTKPTGVRFVISSDSSHHSGTHAANVEVSSLVRSTIPDPPVMTAAVATTAVIETSLVSVPKVKVNPINPALFKDSISISGHNVAGPSSPIHPDLSADSFYAVQDLNLQTLYRYDQLYAEFNVGAARQTCLGAEVRMRAEHTLRKKKILEEESEATEAIRLRGYVTTIEATEALHAAELNLQKQRNSTLKAKVCASEEKVAALESSASVRENEFSSLAANADQLSYDFSILRTAFDELSIKAVALESEKSSLTDQRLLVPDFATKSLVMKYLSVLGKSIGQAVDNGMQDGLAAGIEHGKAGRALSDVAAYKPSTDADYVSAVNALRDVDFSLLTLLASQKDASIANIMDSLHLEGPATEAPDAGEGDVEARHLSLSDAMVLLIEPFPSKNLLGEASTSGIPITADVVMNLSTTFAQSVLVSIPSLSVADYEFVHAEP